MDTIEVTKSGGHPSVLDRLAICTDRKRLVGMFCLGQEIYIKPHDSAALRNKMLLAQEDFYKAFEAQLDTLMYVSGKHFDGHRISIRANPFPTLIDDLQEYPLTRAYENVLFHKYTHPEFIGDSGTVSPLLSSIFVPEETDRYSRMAFQSAYMPVANDSGEVVNFDLLRKTLLNSCNRLKPEHGSAGYCVVLEPGRIYGEPYIYSILQRHPGLGFHGSIAFTDSIRSIYNRIKGVNWLTVLSDEILSELGGIHAAKNQLEPLCGLIPYDGGLVIQAGETPLLGDSSEGNVPPAYRLVAAFTRPVRFEAYSRSLFRVFEPLIGSEEAVKWAQQLD